MMEEVIVRGVRGRIQVCVGSACRVFIALPESLEHLSNVIELDENELELLVLIINGYLSSNANLTCSSLGEIRQANVPSSVGAFDLTPPFGAAPVGSIVLISYSNGQSELFRRVNATGSFQFVSIPGSCG